jgi:hypothetical protein
MARLADTRLTLTGAYVLLGAIVGVLVIHPLNLMFVWWELTRFSQTAPGFWEFMSNRLWLVLLPRHVDVAIAYALIGAVVGVGFGVFTRNYLLTSRAYQTLRAEQTNLVPEIVRRGENDQIEFKSSIRWDMKEDRINRGLEKVIAKTLAGFFNGEGGYLVIGVNDDGEPLGLDKDLSTLRQADLDGYERTINDIVKKMLGGDLCSHIHTVFATLEGRQVAMVIVRPAPRAVYMEDGKSSVLYVRSGNSTRQLDVREALNYAKTRWT